MSTHHPETAHGGIAHYDRPGWLTRNVMNRMTARLTRTGMSLWGSRVLRVRGRASGLFRSTPVNLLTVHGERYLVSPRGQSDWVRNLRVAGSGELVVGRRVESFAATEIDTAGTDGLAIAVLRAYLSRWKWEVGQFFDGVGPDSTDADLLAIGFRHPIFRIETLSR